MAPLVLPAADCIAPQSTRSHPIPVPIINSRIYPLSLNFTQLHSSSTQLRKPFRKPFKSNMAAKEKRPELIAIARDLNGVPMCDDYEKMISGMLYV